jgi:predicted nucleotidyltransferase
MANTVVNTELSGAEVKLKKYFYALRPVLASLWIVENNEVPPMEFGKLRKLLPSELNRMVGDLLIQKTQVDESFKITSIAEIDKWLNKEIEFCEQRVPDAKQVALDSLNELFRKYVV